jgi:hypothetical protein
MVMPKIWRLSTNDRRLFLYRKKWNKKLYSPFQLELERFFHFSISLIRFEKMLLNLCIDLKNN